MIVTQVASIVVSARLAALALLGEVARVEVYGSRTLGGTRSCSTLPAGRS